ncbi:hypothetical protein GF318_05895 [Candidatus Micrarchaeota archaeon]|nr:hypothetical protein [Candidatus Micrarchaeota archaeon]
MLEVLNIVFNGGEVKRMEHNVPESVNVNVNIDKVTLKDPNQALLDFTYSIDYKPKVARLKITGQAYCRDTKENLKKMHAAFKKKKVMPMEYGARVVNMINANAGMNSIFLIRPFNLLPPFMPPMLTTEPSQERTVQKKKKSKKKK